MYPQRFWIKLAANAGLSRKTRAEQPVVVAQKPFYEKTGRQNRQRSPARSCASRERHGRKPNRSIRAAAGGKTKQLGRHDRINDAPDPAGRERAAGSRQ